MKKLLTVLSVLLAFINVEAQNTDPRAFPYTTLQEAVNTDMPDGVRINVTQSGIQGTFTVVPRGTLKVDSGIVVYKNPLQVFVRDTSQATNGFDLRWFNIVPDDTTAAVRKKNRQVLNMLFSDSVPYRNYVVKNTFYVDSTLFVNKFIYLHGPNGYEMIDNGAMAKILYPKGVTAMIFNNNNASSSRIENFTLQGVLPSSGRLVDFNIDDGNVLLLSPYTTILTSQTYEVADPYHAEVVKGTFTLSSVNSTGLDYNIEFIQPSNIFHVGDTLTGSISGAKAVVGFVSKHYHNVVVKAISSAAVWNKKFETLRSNDGDTAVFYAVPLPSRYIFTRVAHIAASTGNIDNPDTTAPKTIDSSALGQDTTSLNITGVLDTIGVSGKRLNLYREQGTYCYGMLVQRRINVYGMSIFNFGGEGIYITNLIKPFTNANLTRVEYCRVSSNGSSAIKVEGGDANHVTILNSTFVSNGGFAILDISFLGISVSYTHSSINLCGSYSSANYINRNSSWLNPYSEGSYPLPPYASISNYLGGGALALGGTWGAPNETSYWRTDGYNGAGLDNRHLQNTDIYTDQTANNRSVVFKGTGVIPHPITLEHRGNSGAGRGPALRFSGPYGVPGWQGPIELKSGAIPYGELQATLNGTAYNYAFKLRRNIPPTTTLVDPTGKGKGAIIAVNTLNGKVISADVIAGGKSYSASSTITIANPTDTITGRKAILIPYIEDSLLAGVYVKDSGLTYLDDEMVDAYELSANGVFRNMLGNGSLGDASHPYVDLYVTNIHSTPGAFIYPDSLVAKTPALSGVKSISMLRLYNPGNTAAGRGPSIDMYGPAGTGIYSPYVSMRGTMDNSFAHSFMLSVYDNSSVEDTMLYANASQIGINTSTPNASAVFHVHSTTLGSIPAPRQTSSQIAGISAPTGGLMVYNRDRQNLWIRDSVNGWTAMTRTDTTTVINGMLPIGNATTGMFKRATLTAGNGIAITNGAGSINIAQGTLTQLTATGTGTSGIVSMMNVKALGNSGQGRGVSLDMESPLAVGTSAMTSRIASYWDGGHGSLGFYTGDSLANQTEKVHINFNGQVGIGTVAPVTGTLFQVESTTKGSLPFPRMTSTQVNAVSSKTGGLGYFNRDKQRYWYYDSTTSKDVAIVASDTTPVADYKVLIGDATNDRFNKGDINAGTNISITKTTSGFTINNTAVGGATAPVIVQVPTGGDTTTSATLVNLSGLSTSLAANTKYYLVINLQVTTVGTGGVRFQFSVPSGASYTTNLMGTTTTTGATAWNAYTGTGVAETATFANAAFGGGSSVASFHWEGILITTGTAGTFQLQFRAITAGELKTVLAGSSIVLTTGQ